MREPADDSARITIRAVASIDELTRVHALLAEQFPARRSRPAHGLDALRAAFDCARGLMVVAERGRVIVGGALALRAGEAVKIDVIALVPAARGYGSGRRLMERIEQEAIRLGARNLYLGGANQTNRGFYSRLGFAGRRSLMPKALSTPAYRTEERSP